MAIGLFSKKESVATLLSQALFLPSLFLSGTMIAIDFLPEFLQGVTDVIPLKHSFVLLQGFDAKSLIISLSFTVVMYVLLTIRYRFIVRRE